MSDRRIHPNATAIDSDIYRDIFGTTAMRDVWSDQARIQYYLEFEEALALTQAHLGVAARGIAWCAESGRNTAYKRSSRFH
jgi:adenylosuccinate lyase